MFNLSQIRRASNRAVSTFQQADFLYREIADRLMERLPFIRLQPRRILECGARTGYLSQQLLQYYSASELVALDYADQQLAQFDADRCCKAAAHHAALPFKDNSFDMVMSSLSLNWTNDLAACFREFKRVLQPNGLLMFTLFGVDTLKELRHSFSACHEFLYRFPDMHDIGDLLLQSGFEDPVMDMETLTIRYKQLTRLFKDFKFSGTGNAHQERPKGLFGKNRWRDALAKYEALKDDAAYPATFEIIYGHGWLSDQKQQQAADEVVFPIEWKR